MCCPPANQRCPDLPHGPGKGTTEGSLAWSKGQQRGSMPCQQPHLAEHTSLFLWEGGEWSSQQPQPRLGQGCRRNWENCQMENTNRPSALSQATTMRKELFQNSSSVSKALFVKRTHPHMRLCVCSLDVVRNLVQLASVVIQDFINFFESKLSSFPQKKHQEALVRKSQALEIFSVSPRVFQPLPRLVQHGHVPQSDTSLHNFWISAAQDLDSWPRYAKIKDPGWNTTGNSRYSL